MTIRAKSHTWCLNRQSLRPLLAITVGLLLVACNGEPTANGQPPATQVATITAAPAATPTPSVIDTFTPTPGSSEGGIILSPLTTPAEETKSASPTPPPSQDQGVTQIEFPPAIALSPLWTLPNPITYLTHAGDGSGRLFIVEKAGRIRIVENDLLLEEPFLDIRDLVGSGGSEQGLLSVAFDPDYEDSGHFYVNYTDRLAGSTIIARYQVTDNPNRADDASGQIVLTIPQPARNHNGGQLQFGPDGYLYIGTGDGGQANDPWDNAENLSVLLGKILRIDVRGTPGYDIPISNPFADQADKRPEIWAYGLRNPWRFSFDRLNGHLYIADVGQNQWEEVNVQSATAGGGQHYGWDSMEGLHCFEPARGCNPADFTLPVIEYDHSQGCSVTGGYVYRGQAYPTLQGLYFFGDYCSGAIWAMRAGTETNWESQPVFASRANIASFGEDEDGELYVLDLQGQVYGLIAVPK